MKVQEVAEHLPDHWFFSEYQFGCIVERACAPADVPPGITTWASFTANHCGKKVYLTCHFWLELVDITEQDWFVGKVKAAFILKMEEMGFGIFRNPLFSLINASTRCAEWDGNVDSLILLVEYLEVLTKFVNIFIGKVYIQNPDMETLYKSKRSPFVNTGFLFDSTKSLLENPSPSTWSDWPYLRLWRFVGGTSAQEAFVWSKHPLKVFLIPFSEFKRRKTFHGKKVVEYESVDALLKDGWKIEA